MNTMYMKRLMGCAASVALATLLIVGCDTERPTYEGPNYILFSKESYDLGVLDNEEWFEIPISATRTADHDRRIGVEVVASRSNAIDGVHYLLESNTLTIKAGELTTAVRMRCNPEAIELTDSLGVALRLVIDKEQEWELYGIDAEVHLHKCCPINLDAFTGYCKITSTWLMQYMSTDSRLVRTERDTQDENVIIVRDMFYEGHDIRLRLLTDNRLNPTVEMEPQQVGTTGEAFGTIYGNGKLLMEQPLGYTSYYSPCETFLVQYATLYVEEVGTVGTYVNIFEWVSDDEAERILREGF